MRSNTLYAIAIAALVLGWIHLLGSAIDATHEIYDRQQARVKCLSEIDPISCNELLRRSDDER